MSAAKCEAGWGGEDTEQSFAILTCNFATPPRSQVRATLPLQGRVKNRNALRP